MPRSRRGGERAGLGSRLAESVVFRRAFGRLEEGSSSLMACPIMGVALHSRPSSRLPSMPRFAASYRGRPAGANCSPPDVSKIPTPWSSENTETFKYAGRIRSGRIPNTQRLTYPTQPSAHHPAMGRAPCSIASDPTPTPRARLLSRKPSQAGCGTRMAVHPSDPTLRRSTLDVRSSSCPQNHPTNPHRPRRPTVPPHFILALLNIASPAVDTLTSR